MRLIVLTDGADTESKSKMPTLARRLESMKCVVDAVVVGKIMPHHRGGGDLLALAAYCRGAILIPPTPAAAMQIFEAETMQLRSARAGGGVDGLIMRPRLFG